MLKKQTISCVSLKKTEDDSVVLDPDNPLLDRFQKALKEHLLRQIEHLKNDNFEYECGTKKNNLKREELGVYAYELQQNITKQQTSLDNTISRLDEVHAAREAINLELKEKHASLKNAKNNLLIEENKELELRNEIESINFLIQQITQWEENLESDITTKKRVYEKSRKVKQKLLQEKRQQDALIYKLMTRIWQLEHELTKMDTQIKVKEEEREEMAQNVAYGNTNIEAIQSEYRALMHSWNSVVVAIGNRDRILICIGGELTKTEESFKSVHAETEQVKKLTLQEQKKNEMLTVIKNRFSSDNQKCKSNFDTEMLRKQNLERRMMEMTGIIEQTNFDIDKLEVELQDAQKQLDTYQHEFATINQIKNDFELKIIAALEDQVTNNKNMAHLRRTLHEIKKRNKEVETQIAIIENKISCISSDIDLIKMQNKDTDKYLQELKDQQNDLEKEADKYQDEIKKMEIKINQRQREMDYLAVKYQKTLEKSMTTDECASPLESKISALERGMEEIQEQNKKMQQFWLREQTNLLNISQERQDQIQNNELIRKQIMIMEQKNLKITDDLERQKHIDSKLSRSIINLGSRLAMLSDTVSKTKGIKLEIDKEADMIRQDYIYKLKDAELECLRIKDEIEQIEEEKVLMSQELIELNRRVLEWEKKYICAKETKCTMHQEQSKDGELGGMKVEIHRMNVRFSQLKKVQDVLIHDLEHCISRRDAILTVTEAREKRSKNAVEKTRINFHRKLDDLRNRIKQMQDEIEDFEEKMRKMVKEKANNLYEIESLKERLDSAKQQKQCLYEEIETVVTDKQMNIELLLQMQKKYNICSSINRGDHPALMYRTASSVTMEYSKEKDIGNRLLNICDLLREEFPQMEHHLNRCTNTLKLPMFVSIP